LRSGRRPFDASVGLATTRWWSWSTSRASN
jgi:hypothetical protein